MQCLPNDAIENKQEEAGATEWTGRETPGCTFRSSTLSKIFYIFMLKRERLVCLFLNPLNMIN
jgi:hypothetical protein